ncbi:MAG: polymer-forming cytoskeletal protein [Chloroflexi bacterium]|nr:polymer-forming cytoskeletal protein [Chloroflexota bacterium]
MSFFGTRRQADPTPPPSQPERPEPPRPPVSQSPVGFETVLGANSTVEGTLSSSSNVRLDGTFKGTLEITGNILVGETAKIEADINAKNISVAGAVRGNISGKKVQLLRTGRVWGDIRAAALTTEEGAFIDGKITMVSHEAAAPAESPVEAETTAVSIPAPVEPETAISDQPETLPRVPSEDGPLGGTEAPDEP